MQQVLNSSFWKRYFVLILAVSLFLAIAAALIGVSLLLSTQIAQGALARDLSGAERSASQIVLRSMLEMDQDLKAGRAISSDSRDTLKRRSELIGNTIKVFREGGRMPSDKHAAFKLQSASPEMIQTNAKIAEIWAPYEARIKAFLASADADPRRLDDAIAYGRANNDALFDLLNTLVKDTQNITEQANRRLTLAQTLGAGLILLNFMFTALVAFRRLLAGDRAIAQSRKQTQDILATVKEGLFLVTADFKIGGQMSQSLSQVMQRRVEPGMDLIELLRPMVAASTLDSARDYLGLLFGKRVKENLVASLNPLSEVPVAGGTDGRGKSQPRYLNFQFNRVLENEAAVHLLVTVSDATERVRLHNEVSAAKTRTREEMESLLRVLSRDSTEVRFFLHRVGVVLERVNDDLRQAAGRRGGTDYAELVNAIFRDVHSLKSEAAALNLEMLEALAHNFEVDLISLRDRGAIEGGDMVKMTVHLDDMFECAATIREFLDRMAATGEARESTRVKPAQRLADGWNSLAERIAGEQGKQVRVQMQLDALDRAPAETLNAMRTIGLQLLRNAVAHGIEPVKERLSSGKPEFGTIIFRSADAGSHQVELIARDDGRGIDVARIRAALAACGRYSPEQLKALSDREAMMKIFESGVSTSADQGDRDSGHGIGMDLVMKQVRALAGTISLSTKVGEYTEFRIRLPMALAKLAEPAPSGDGTYQLSL